MTRTAFPALLVLLLAACALGPAAKPEDDAKARLLQPVPDKAVIYLIRDRGDLYTANVKLTVDGKDMGESWPGTYFRWELPPGEHTIISYTYPPAALTIDTAPGGIYHVWQDINPGHQREHSQLRIVDVTTTQQNLGSLYLLQNKE
jgi:hypothetical protein